MKNAATVARDGADILHQRRQSCWWNLVALDPRGAASDMAMVW
jgi:hypothetical protein